MSSRYSDVLVFMVLSSFIFFVLSHNEFIPEKVPLLVRKAAQACGQKNAQAVRLAGFTEISRKDFIAGIFLEHHKPLFFDPVALLHRLPPDSLLRILNRPDIVRRSDRIQISHQCVLVHPCIQTGTAQLCFGPRLNKINSFLV